MAGLVVPNVARYSVIGEFSGVPVANVIDMSIGTPAGSARDNNVLDQAEVILQNWVEHICPLLSNSYRANEVTWVDMHNASGTTGSITEGEGADFPQVGGVGGAPMPGSVAFLVRKNSTHRRGQRQGRMYLPGVAEASTPADGPNNVAAGVITAMNTALASFLSGISQSDGVLGGEYDSKMVTVHTRNNGTPSDPQIVFVDKSDVISLTVDGKVHSQRRRLGL